MSSDDVSRIVLLGYPVRLGALQQEHLDEVSREFMLLSLARPEVDGQVPGRLLELRDLLTRRHGADLEEPRRVREQALQDGVEHVDLVYPVVPDARRLIQQWHSTMREVDAYCRQDELLSLATPPEVVALQDWVLGEFLGQLEGHAPTPWPGVPSQR